ncbi:MAG TPA: hypothetical protein VJB87_00955 [Candidatus Nanoarchaeia archaeon]|nr:hypothetical protein [Candidatus Nanoarchaeia archaeon]
MVLCWIALPIFALLGIFSAKYRKLTKESLACLFKTITLQRCESGLDQRIRADITAKMMHTPQLAKLFYNHYKIIAFIFIILMLGSAYFSGIGVYNYVAYGNCNGEDSTAFCIFNVFENETPTTNSETPTNCTLPNASISLGGTPP